MVSLPFAHKILLCCERIAAKARFDKAFSHENWSNGVCLAGISMIARCLFTSPQEVPRCLGDGYDQGFSGEPMPLVWSTATAKSSSPSCSAQNAMADVSTSISGLGVRTIDRQRATARILEIRWKYGRPGYQQIAVDFADVFAGDAAEAIEMISVRRRATKARLNA